MWEFILIRFWILCLKGGAFGSLLILFRDEDFCAQGLSREKGFCSLQVVPRVSWGGGGGGGIDEIYTCVCHRYVKSDIARSTSVDQVNHSSLKTCKTFSITKAKQLNLWIKTILSVAIS